MDAPQSYVHITKYSLNIAVGYSVGLSAQLNVYILKPNNGSR